MGGEELSEIYVMIFISLFLRPHTGEITCDIWSSSIVQIGVSWMRCFDKQYGIRANLELAVIYVNGKECMNEINSAHETKAKQQD